MFQQTLRYGIYAGVGTLLLALTGIFSDFASRAVIAGGLLFGVISLAPITLSEVFLIVTLLGTAYFAASRASVEPLARIAHGVVAALIVALLLSGLVILQANVNLTFVFPDIGTLLGSTVTFGQTEMLPGLLSLLGVALLLGAVGGALPLVSPRLRSVLFVSLGLLVGVGLLTNQLQSVMTLPDALALALTFALGYAVARLLPLPALTGRLLVSLMAGVIVGVALAMAVDSGALAPGGALAGRGNPPVILAMAPESRVPVFALVFGIVGLVGAATSRAARYVHDAVIYFLVALVLLGVINGLRQMTPDVALLVLVILLVALWVVPRLGRGTQEAYESLPRPARQSIVRVVYLAGLVVLIVAPQFLGQNITNVFNLMGLYIIMGIGLNVVVGFAGLLDLGYVAFFAIGAYTLGLLTTPSMLTCGGLEPRDITPDTVSTLCTGVMTFWQAWPIAIALSALSGVLLGIPVLRLRGDYLAIVTLGFGEIIRLIVKFDDFKPLLGASQGIPNIPRPVIDLTALNSAWRFELSGTSIYYLVLFGIVVTAVIAIRLSHSRIGRAWRAMRADEDVAQAMGINITRAKLLAFGIGAAFAGMGGAVFASMLFGAYPDSFTLPVSINVLSLVIIGGLGSIPGVIIGALMLIGLPEILRELADYRLLAFGALLVVTMLLKPDGLVPPSVRRLSERAEERHLAEGVAR